MWNLKVQVSKLGAPTELRLYVGALIPRDKTIFSQTSPACIITTIQISTMINKSSKINFTCTKYLISVTTSMEDETKNGSELLVRVPFDTKKRLSYTIKQFPKLVEESLESLSITPEQILQYGALDLIKKFCF